MNKRNDFYKNFIRGIPKEKMFHQMLLQAQQEKNVQINDLVHNYLVALLIDYYSGQNKQGHHLLNQTPIAITYLEARQKNDMALYHQLADQCLLKGSLADPNQENDLHYIITIGQNAYQALAVIWQKHLPPTPSTLNHFSYLAKEFALIIQVLHYLFYHHDF
jgi:hypothetical protein